MSDWVNVNSCRICDRDTVEVANFGNLALTSIFPNAAEKIPYIPMTVRHCRHCGLLQLGENTNPALMYKPGYGYKSGVNETMVNHLNGIVKYAWPYAGNNGTVLDIGCNDGTLLKLWDKYISVKKYGYDPIGEYIDGATVTKDYFSEHGRKYDVITSISMFYDIPNPIKFAKDIFESLTPNGIWIVEVGYAGMLQKGYWDGIVHEHLTYYGLKQFQYIATSANLRIKDFSFNDCNGGSLRVTLERNDVTFKPHHPDAYKVIQLENEWEWDSLWDNVVNSAKSIREAISGKLTYVLGASTKGNAILQLIGATPELIPAAVERNPDKFGKVTPGTNIPIMSEEWLRENHPEMLLVLPYHFREGMLERYKDLRGKGVKFVFPIPSVDIV
jgi:NDP-4-keto-2,6-dideoxyhexose 3-C-methyltransferase